MTDMTDILNLVKSGKLNDATAAIQNRLKGADTAADTAGRPMRDVTPRARQLPSPHLAQPEPAEQKSAKPRARTKSGMARHTGPLNYRLFTPTTPVATAPLIVMLHGCTQTPEDFAAGTRMNAAADRLGAHVIWPEQARAANTNLCWNWFDPAHQGRSGEAAAIAQIAASVRSRHTPQTSGIHVAGLSAGGAMAAILGARYPEIFNSVGVHSGLPVGAAQDMGSAFMAMRSGGKQTAPLTVPAIVFHGASDQTVAPVNGTAFIGATSEKPRQRTSKIGGRGVTVTRTDGPPQTEHWAIAGLGHAWSGGARAGSYADPKGPDATSEMLRFFKSVDQS